MIFTDAKGVPFAKPSRSAHVSDTEYLRACWAFRDAIAKASHESFDDTFRREMRALRGSK